MRDQPKEGKKKKKSEEKKKYILRVGTSQNKASLERRKSSVRNLLKLAMYHKDATKFNHALRSPEPRMVIGV